MLVVVTYDVRTSSLGEKRGWPVSPRPAYGQRVQYSVFEIEVDPAQWTKLRSRLEGLIKPEHDRLRYYYLGANWRRRVEHVGAKPAVDLGGHRALCPHVPCELRQSYQPPAARESILRRVRSHSRPATVPLR